MTDDETARLAELDRLRARADGLPDGDPELWLILRRMRQLAAYFVHRHDQLAAEQAELLTERERLVAERERLRAEHARLVAEYRAKFGEEPHV